MSFPNKPIHKRKFQKNKQIKVETKGMDIKINNKKLFLFNKPIQKSYVVVDFENVKITLLNRNINFSIFIEEYYKNCIPIFVYSKKLHKKNKIFLENISTEYYIVIINNVPNIPEIDDYLINIIFMILHNYLNETVTLHSYDHYESNYNLGNNEFNTTFLFLHRNIYTLICNLELFEKTPFEYRLRFFDGTITISNSISVWHNYIILGIEMQIKETINIQYHSIFSKNTIFIDLIPTKEFTFLQIILYELSELFLYKIDIQSFNDNLINNLRWRHKLV